MTLDHGAEQVVDSSSRLAPRLQMHRALSDVKGHLRKSALKLVGYVVVAFLVLKLIPTLNQALTSLKHVSWEWVVGAVLRGARRRKAPGLPDEPAGTHLLPARIHGAGGDDAAEPALLSTRYFCVVRLEDRAPTVRELRLVVQLGSAPLLVRLRQIEQPS